MKRNRDKVVETIIKRIAAARICIPRPIADHDSTYGSFPLYRPRVSRRKTAATATLLSLFAIALWLITRDRCLAQSVPDDEMFDPVNVINGIQIAPSACHDMERRQTALWVSVDGRGYCLSYYAAGLTPGGPNPLVAAWMSGDIMGGPKGVAHQQGLGVASMIEQSKALSDQYGVPYIFLARPGTYGSAGKHYDIRHRPLEARLVAAHPQHRPDSAGRHPA